MKKKVFSLIAIIMLIVPISLTSIFSAGQVLAAETGEETIANQNLEDETITSVVPDENLRSVLAASVGKEVGKLEVSDLEKIIAISIDKNIPESFDILKVKDFTGLERTNMRELNIQNLTEEQTEALWALDFEEMGKHVKFSTISLSHNSFKNGIDYSRFLPVISEENCHIRANGNHINTYHKLTKSNYKQLVVETKDFGMIMPDGSTFEFKKYSNIFVNNMMTFYHLENIVSGENDELELNYAFVELSYLEEDKETPSDKYVYNLMDADTVDYDSLAGKTFSLEMEEGIDKIGNLELGSGGVFDFSSSVQLTFDTNRIYSHIYFEPDVPEVKTGKVTVNYVDEAGKELEASEELTGDVGTAYETKAKEISGYELIKVPNNATGTHTEEDIVVTYVYKQAGTPIDKEDPKEELKDKPTVSKKVLPQTGENAANINIKIVGMLFVFAGVLGVIIKKMHGKRTF